MPRLDPFQLLKTVSVLLSPDGGIKSEHEVLRLVQLMQKFSKKIVSKTIYVEILKVTCQPLLQQFLKLEGWELLNLWFLECIKTHNWPLCVEIMTLFLVCPVTADLLKVNADVNQGPRLINQIRLNEALEESVRGLANSVYEKWYGVLSPTKATTAPVKVTIKVPSGKVVVKPLTESLDNGSSRSSLSDKEKKISRSPDDKRSKEKERLKSKERERDKYKERDRKRKDETSLNNSTDKERKRFRPDRRDEVNAEEKQRIKEKARLLKEEAQAKKDKETLSKVTGSSSSTGLSKIPKIPKKVLPPTDDKQKPMSFEALLGGLDTKPKNVKTPMVKNKTAALLESFSKPSSGTSKSQHHHHHHHHNSKKDGHSSRHDKDSKKESSGRSHDDKKLQSAANKFPKITIPKRTSGDLESPKSKSGSFAESPSFMDAILNSMSTSEEPRKKKRRLSGSAEKSTPEGKGESTPEVKKEEEKAVAMAMATEGSPEPKPEKKEPTFSFYRDTLEDPEEERPIEARRPIRRPLKIDSDSDEENNKKEDGDSNSPSKDSTPSPKTEEDSQTSNETDVKEESRDSQSSSGLPKSILVVGEFGRRKKQSIRFREGPNLVEVRYFELDESERVNVNKIKFENMRKIDMDSENAAMKSKREAGCEEVFWYQPRLVLVDNRQPFVPGHKSLEKDVQLNRETTVLAAFLLNKESIPDTPSEPDLPIIPLFVEKTKVIPLIDLEGDNSGQTITDFSSAGWPEPRVNDVDQRADQEPNINSLLSSIDVTGLQPHFQKPPPGLSQEEQNMLMVQKEAMLKLGISMPGYQSTRVPPPGLAEVPPPFPPRFRPPPASENNKPEGAEFNEGPAGAPGFEGPPEQFGGPGFNGNPENFPPRFNVPPDQFGPRFNGPPGFNGHQDGFPQPPGGFNGPPFVRGNMRPNFNNFGPPRGVRGGFNPGFRGGRGPPGPPPMRGPPPEFFHRRGNMSARPCKFFTQRGFCRDGDQCKFLHEQ